MLRKYLHHYAFVFFSIVFLFQYVSLSSLEFLIEPSDLFINEYGTGILHCQAVHRHLSQHPYYQWILNGDYKKSFQSTFQNGSLVVTSNELGIYKCLASNTYGFIISKEARVWTFSKNYSFHQYRVPDGSYVLFPFPNITGQPNSLKYHWQYRPKEGNDWIFIDKKHFTITGSLFKQMFYSQDEGATYRLVIEEGTIVKLKTLFYGNISITDRLSTLLGSFQTCKKLVTIKSNVNRKYYVGDDIKLEYLVAFQQCKDSMTYTWYFQKKQWLSHKVIIKNATLAHTGSYTFYASYSRYTFTKSIRVTVHDKPKILVWPVHPIRLKDTKQTLIQYLVHRIFGPFYVSWYFDGYPLNTSSNRYTFLSNGSLLIKPLKPTDTGYYQIVVTFDNKYLSRSVFLQVVPEVPGCGGKNVGLSGIISFKNTKKGYEIFTCDWLISIPMEQTTVVQVTRLRDNNNTNEKCDYSWMSVKFGQGLSSDPNIWIPRALPESQYVTRLKNIFITAYINASCWINGGFQVKFFPRKRNGTFSVSTSSYLPITVAASFSTHTLESTCFIKKSSAIQHTISQSSAIQHTISQSSAFQHTISQSSAFQHTTSHSSGIQHTINQMATAPLSSASSSRFTFSSTFISFSDISKSTPLQSCCLESSPVILSQKNNRTVDVIIIIIPLTCAVLVLATLLVVTILCCKKRRSTDEGKSTEKTTGRRNSFFNTIGSSSCIVTQIELEENEQYTSCDAAFFSDYFDNKNSLKRDEKNEDSLDSSADDRVQYSTPNIGINHDNKSNDDDDDGEVYHVLEPEDDDYQRLSGYDNGVYANPYTNESNSENDYQPLDKFQPTENKVPSIQISTDENGYQALTESINYEYDAALKSSTLPHYSHTDQLRALQEPTLRSGSTGGKYNTEDYVFM